jgi:hypothetical protein
MRVKMQNTKLTITHNIRDLLFNTQNSVESLFGVFMRKLIQLD